MGRAVQAAAHVVAAAALPLGGCVVYPDGHPLHQHRRFNDLKALTKRPNKVAVQP